MMQKGYENRYQIEMISIEDLVPQEHLLRQISSAVNFEKIYEFVEELYCDDNGRPSIDPVVLFKMVLIQHLYGLPSLRRTADEVSLNIAYRWFLGYGLTDETRAPHIVSVGFAGIRSEVLLHTLEDKGIYVSSGSACASNHPSISGVLKGIGAGTEYLDATLRFSFSEFTTRAEIDYTLETLYNCVPILRKYTRH